MNKLIEIWKLAAQDLGFDIQTPFSIQLPSGTRINAPLLVRNFGAVNGMLIVTQSQDVWGSRSELTDQGYGFSVLSVPETNTVYIRNEYIEVLNDWGWSGPPKEKPSWILDLPEGP